MYQLDGFGYYDYGYKYEYNKMIYVIIDKITGSYNNAVSLICNDLCKNKTLQKLPKSLEKLECKSNKLTGLPKLPKKNKRIILQQ
jgi:hypothetical protein